MSVLACREVKISSVLDVVVYSADGDWDMPRCLDVDDVVFVTMSISL